MYTYPRTLLLYGILSDCRMRTLQSEVPFQSIEYILVSHRESDAGVISVPQMYLRPARLPYVRCSGIYSRRRLVAISGNGVVSYWTNVLYSSYDGIISNLRIYTRIRACSTVSSLVTTAISVENFH